MVMGVVGAIPRNAYPTPSYNYFAVMLFRYFHSSGQTYFKLLSFSFRFSIVCRAVNNFNNHNINSAPC